MVNILDFIDSKDIREYNRNTTLLIPWTRMRHLGGRGTAGRTFYP